MVYIFTAEGFEEIEALTAADLLRRAEIELKIISTSDTGETTVTGAHQIRICADDIIHNIELKTDDVLVIPGGPGTSNLQACEKLSKMIDTAFLNRQLVCAICAAPSLLRKHIRNKKFTCYKGYEKELIDLGGIYSDSSCVTYENIITANSPSSALAFSLAIIEKIKDTAVRHQIEEQILLR